MLVASWFLAKTDQDEDMETTLIKELDGKLKEILGLGHHLQSCIQFLDGNPGKKILADLVESSQE